MSSTDTYRKEIKRIKKEFERMKENNFDVLSITIPYTIPNKDKKILLQEAIDEFNFNNDNFQVYQETDVRKMHQFSYKDKSIIKQIKDFFYYGILPNDIRCEYSINVLQNKTKQNKTK
jgi:hypothetical protein